DRYHSDDEHAESASRKFDHEFAGPFTILDLHGNVAILDIPHNWLQLRTYNVDRLTLDRVDHSYPYPPIPALHSTKVGDEYEEEKLLNHPGSTVKTLQYHVKLAGNDDTESQPLANLVSGCKQFSERVHESTGYRYTSGCTKAED
ncbi:hypothetical protein FN846DRAFT_896756, partial [Sphaerosporella brunnea]